MYFVILWKHREISLEELNILEPINLKIFKDVAYFDTNKSQYLPNLWWIIKYWKIISVEDIAEYLYWTQLVWVNEESLWLLIKRKYWIKRFKNVKTMWTDLDIKKEWKEFILIWNDLKNDSLIWMVTWYQDIALFETVDFEKPYRSMKIWMMPAKLTSMLINIWLSMVEKKQIATIYDPFAWFWTTGFLANYLWNNFIWSDLNITPCKQNFAWWESNNYYKDWLKVTLFKHDVKDPFNKNFLQEVDLIVSEWRLGPALKWFVSAKTIEHNANEIFEVYKAFFTNVKNFWKKINIVITVPHYIWENDILTGKILQCVEELWFKWWFLKQMYQRTEQKVWRQILKISL